MPNHTCCGAPCLRHPAANPPTPLPAQFGLSAFRWQAAPAPARGGSWEARTFNAYIFPRPDDSTGMDKRFLCQASSLTYLAEQVGRREGGPGAGPRRRGPSRGWRPGTAAG